MGNFVTAVDSNKVYICTQEGFILSTVDEGESWIEKSVSPGLPLRGISFPTSTLGFAVGDGGVFRTMDAGTTWHNVRTGHLRSVFFVSESVGFAAGHLPDGVIKTVNGGTSWTQVVDRPCHLVYFANENVGFAVPFLPTTDTILRTADAGVSWSKVVVPEFTISFGAAAFSFVNTSTGFLAEWEKGIYKSIDAGISWSPVQLDLPGHWYSRSLHFLDEMNGFAVGLNDSTGTIIRTKDGGNHWSVVHIHDSAGITYTGIAMTSAKRGFVSSVGKNLRIEENDTITAATDKGQRPVVVYPNPSTGEILVDGCEGVVDIVITDVLGQEILRTKAIDSTTRFHISDPGLYLIRLEGPRVRQLLKVVITR